METIARKLKVTVRAVVDRIRGGDGYPGRRIPVILPGKQEKLGERKTRRKKWDQRKNRG